LLRLEASTKKSIFSFLGNNAGYGWCTSFIS
jgi:hypothetical protein